MANERTFHLPMTCGSWTAGESAWASRRQEQNGVAVSSGAAGRYGCRFPLVRHPMDLVVKVLRDIPWSFRVQAAVAVAGGAEKAVFSS
jgi:hypothetical protein